MSLAALAGQPAATARLLAALRRPSHAYLFAGPAPVGKRKAAKAFGQALLCEAPTPERDACGACATCRAIEGPGHPDFREWDVAEGDKTFKVDQVRELIAAVSRKPFSRPRQVHVLAALDLVQPAGANALLKTLEEPPPTTTLVLLATDVHGVLPTLVSRCQVVLFAADPAPPLGEPPPWPMAGDEAAWADALAACTAAEQAAALDALLGRVRDAALAEPAAARAWVTRAEAVEAARDALARHANARLVFDRLARRLQTHS